MMRTFRAVVLAICTILLLTTFSVGLENDELNEIPITNYSSASENDEAKKEESMTKIPDLSPNSIKEKVSDYPTESVIIVATIGGFLVYVFGLRKQRKELNKTLKVLIISKSEEKDQFRASLKAIDILKKTRATAFALGPFSWLWDELLHPIISEKLTEHGISDIYTFEGIISWVMFDILNLNFMTPIEFKHNLFPQIRMISTILFLLLVYWIFFKGDSLIRKYKGTMESEIEENESEKLPSRKGYV